MLIRLCIIYDCFHMTVVELRSYERDHVALKIEHVCRQRVDTCPSCHGKEGEGTSWLALFTMHS